MHIRKPRRKAPGLVLTPMIDMFTIIIVYLIVNYAPEASKIKKSENIKLPKSSMALQKVPPIQLEVTAESVKINGTSIEGLSPQDATPEAWVALGSKLAELKKKDHPVLLISDRGTSYGHVDRAVGQVAAAGFSEIYFLTEESKAPKEAQ